VPLWTRSPAQLAMACATLQEASGGRFVLGLGVSHPATMGPWHGAEVRAPRTAAGEALTILRQLEAGETSDVDGEVLRSERFRLRISPALRPRTRLLAAMGPRMLELAGTDADGTLLNWSSAAEVARAGERVRTAAERAGRDPERSRSRPTSAWRSPRIATPPGRRSPARSPPTRRCPPTPHTSSGRASGTRWLA
jgi:alkanesulfonate monooxygenase SsuD/methylene tetrahydromethanopterin reductase-like flavin-dependent oxidoreductase (luciferase family)